MKTTRVAIALIAAALAALAAACSDTVEPVVHENNPPVITAMFDTTATVGDTLLLRAQATDRDGDAIKYHLTVIIRSRYDTLPDAVVDSKTGAFAFRPIANDKPERVFIIDVNDGHGGEDETRFTVSVD